METAAKLNSPVIIQFSNGGGQFFAGKGLKNENEHAAIAGSIAGAKHIHELAELYGATVILHTDHCSKSLLPWVDGLLLASEKHFASTGKPLFSSHMLDLSEESLEENIHTCVDYFKELKRKYGKVITEDRAIFDQCTDTIIRQAPATAVSNE